MKLAQRALILIAVPLTLEIAVVSTLTFTLKQLEAEYDAEARSRETMAIVASQLHRIIQAAGMLGLWSIDLKNGQRYEAAIETAQRTIDGDSERLDELTSERPSENVREFQRATADYRVLLRQMISKVKSHEVANDKIEQAHDIIARSGAAADGIKKEQTVLNEEQRNAQTMLRSRVLLISTVAVGLSVFLAIGLAIYFNVGTTRRLNHLSRKMLDFAAGKPLGTPLQGNDEIKDIDATFHTMADELIAARKQRQELTAMATHDLKTPLGTIEIFLQLLSTGQLGELNTKGESRTRQIRAIVRRMVILINDLLDVEKDAAGKLVLNVSDTTASALAESARMIVSPLAEQSDVSLVVETKDIPLRCDSDRIVRVLVNLLHNAIKFSPAGSTVYLRSKQENGKALFEVEDEGRGIAEEELPRLFQPFEQLRPSEDTARGGTGLGLSACKRIVDAHGGEISARVNPTAGTTFSFSLSTVGAGLAPPANILRSE